MNQDRIELITEQLESISILWGFLLAANLDISKKGIVEELLLEVLEIKQSQLCDCL